MASARNIGTARKRRIKRSLLKRDGDLCVYCNGEMIDASTIGTCITLPMNIQTIDHVIPLSKGGTWELENLVLCCLECNQWKDDR